MRKLKLAAAIAAMFPGIGPGQTPSINFLGALPDQPSLTNAILGINPFQEAIYGVDTATASKTVTGSQISGATFTILNFTGTFGAGGAITLPTVANLIASLPALAQASPVGLSWQFRLLNTNTTQTLTVTTNTGWTLSGTQTVATNTWRDFIITITSATAATIQSVGVGTQS